MPDISKTYTNIWAGISDDSFIGPENSVLDMDGIEIQTNERYFTGMERYIETNTRSHSGDAIWVKETEYGVFRSTGGTTLNPSGATLSLGLATVEGMESYGTGTEQINYFFGRTDGVRKTDYLGTTNIGAISTSGYPTANSPVTAIGWHVTNIIFAKQNVLYSYSTTTDTTTTATTLMPGTQVKYIFSYSYDSIVVATTNGDDTYIYELEFTGSAYNIVSRTPIYSEKLISAVANYYELYWVSQFGINLYAGRQNQFIKYKTFTDNTRLGYDRGLIIIDGTGDIYYFGKKKPGRNLSLRKISTSFTPNLIDKTTILDSSSIGSSVLSTAGAFKREMYVTFRPLDGGIYNVPKHDLDYRIGYKFERGGYTNTATKQEIEVYIQTDGMEMINTVTYISVGKVTDSTNATGPDSINNPKYGYFDVTSNMIKDALQTAGYPSQFGYVRTKLVLRAGDEFSSPTGYYRKCPSIFDITMNANYVKR